MIGEYCNRNTAALVLVTTARRIVSLIAPKDLQINMAPLVAFLGNKLFEGRAKHDQQVFEGTESFSEATGACARGLPVMRNTEGAATSVAIFLMCVDLRAIL